MDKSKPEGKPLEAKSQYHSREFKLEAVRQNKVSDYIFHS